MAGIGERNRHRRRGEIEDPGRMERVPVHADDALAIDRHHVPMMHEPAEPVAAHQLREMEIGLGPNEIVASGPWAMLPSAPYPSAQRRRSLRARSTHSDAVAKSRGCRRADVLSIISPLKKGAA